MICSGRVVVFLFGLVVVASPVHAESEGDAGEDAASSSDADHGTNDTASPGGSDDADPTSPHRSQSEAYNADGTPPCGLVHWSPGDPDRVVVDPNHCFLPLIQDLIKI